MSTWLNHAYLIEARNSDDELLAQTSSAITAKIFDRITDLSTFTFEINAETDLADACLEDVFINVRDTTQAPTYTSPVVDQFKVIRRDISDSTRGAIMSVVSQDPLGDWVKYPVDVYNLPDPDDPEITEVSLATIISDLSLNVEIEAGIDGSGTTYPFDITEPTNKLAIIRRLKDMIEAKILAKGHSDIRLALYGSIDGSGDIKAHIIPTEGFTIDATPIAGQHTYAGKMVFMGADLNEISLNQDSTRSYDWVRALGGMIPSADKEDPIGGFVTSERLSLYDHNTTSDYIDVDTGSPYGSPGIPDGRVRTIVNGTFTSKQQAGLLNEWAQRQLPYIRDDVKKVQAFVTRGTYFESEANQLLTGERVRVRSERASNSLDAELIVEEVQVDVALKVAKITLQSKPIFLGDIPGLTGTSGVGGNGDGSNWGEYPDSPELLDAYRKSISEQILYTDQRLRSFVARDDLLLGEVKVNGYPKGSFAIGDLVDVGHDDIVDDTFYGVGSPYEIEIDNDGTNRIRRYEASSINNGVLKLPNPPSGQKGDWLLIYLGSRYNDTGSTTITIEDHLVDISGDVLASYVLTDVGQWVKLVATTAGSFPEWHVVDEGLIGSGGLPLGSVNDMLQHDGSNWAVDSGSVRDFFNGTIQESFDALVTSAAGTITLSLEPTAGAGDLTMRFSDGNTALDCDPAKTIVLTAGTDPAPQANYIYIPKSSKVLTKSTSEFPSAEHIKIGFFFVPSAAYVASDGVYINQNWNDHSESDNGQGHLSHVGERIRYSGANYFSGIDPNGEDQDTETSYFDYVSDTEAYFMSTAGVILQMHKHTMGAIDTRAEDIHVTNWNGDAYHDIHDLTDIVADSAGVTLANKYFNVFFFAVGNKTGEYAPMMAMLPDGSYVKEESAINDIDKYDNLVMPREFGLDSSTGTPVCRMTLRYSGGTNVLNHIHTVDMRRLAGGGGAGAVASDFTTFETVAEAEAATSSDNRRCYVVETESYYRYEADGSAYTDDNTFVLSTGDAGDTRWLAVAGQYVYDTLNVTGDLTLYEDITTHKNSTMSDNRYVYSSDFDYHSARRGFFRARGTQAAPEIVEDGDSLGGFRWYGRDDDDNWVPAATFFCDVDSTPGTLDMPARLTWGVTADGDDDTTDRMALTEAGYLGLGTNTPVCPLHVKGTSSGATPHAYSKFFVEYGAGRCGITIGSLNSETAYFFFADPDSNTVGYIAYGHANDSMIFYAGGNKWMQAESDGRVFMPDVYGDAVTGRDMYIKNDGQVGYLSSMREDKEQIIDMPTTESEKIHALRPRRYIRKDTGLWENGLIAEEVNDVWPEMVSYKRIETTPPIPDAPDLLVTEERERWIDAHQPRPTAEMLEWFTEEQIADFIARNQPTRDDWTRTLQEVEAWNLDHEPERTFEDSDIPQTVNYSRLVMPLIKEVQELKKRLVNLEVAR